MTLILLMGVASCGTSSTLGRIQVTPLGEIKLDTAAEYPSGSFPVILDAGEGSVVTVGQDQDGLLHLIRYDRALQKMWQLDIGLGSYTRIESSGLHIYDGKLYLPALYGHADGVVEYKLHTVDIANGEATAPNTLLRLNRNDVAALSDEFASSGNVSQPEQVRSVWTPDSSKILLFKQYATGNGRISIEMMLYKRGFSLITKNNVDFRLDTNTQRLIGILPDNDGVAYLFLHNLADSSIEVGRFEILGSKKLRTLKYKLTSASVAGSIAVAPRGHAYVVYSRSQGAGAGVQLVDFDFYVDKPRAIEVASATEAVTSLSAPSIYVLPDQDRLLVRQRGAVLGDAPLSAYDLDLRPVWRSRIDGHQLFGSAIGYLELVNDRLRLVRVYIANGKEVSAVDLAQVEGLTTAMIEQANVMGKQIYFVSGRLYRLTLP